MNRLDFDCPFDLVDTITALLGDINDDYPVISVYGMYDVIKDILEDLIASGVSIANEIELQDYDVAYYDKEFVLYLTVNGINVEKIWHDDTYYYGSADISFIHEDCNSKLLSYVDSKTIYEFGYDGDECDDEDECSCDECECTCKKDKNPTTTIASKSTYSVNGKKVDKDTYEKTLNELDEKYLNNVQDMLLNYFDFVSEMNEWRKLLGW